MDVPSGGWPLSAAATALLHDPRTKPEEVLKLALKELVLRRVWRTERQPPRGRRRRGAVVLVSGVRPVPALVPLPLADEALRTVVPAAGGHLGAMVNQVLALDSRLPERLRDAALEELTARGLLELRRKRVLGLIPRTVMRTTMSGESWLMDVAGRESSLRTAIARTSREFVPQMAALGGLVLLLDPDTLDDVESVMRRIKQDAAVTGGGAEGAYLGAGDGGFDDVGALDDAGALDVGELDAIGDLDGSFDSALGGGFEGAGDGGFDGGGDGGGGDGGGQ